MQPNVAKIPQHDKRSEECVLGAMLCAPEAAGIAAGMLTESDFYLPRHRDIFGILASMHREGVPIDECTALGELRDIGLGFEGDDAFIGQLIIHTPTAANIEQYCERVRVLSRKRLIEQTVAQAYHELQKPESDTADILSGLRNSFDEIGTESKAGPVTIGDWLRNPILLSEIQRISSGFQVLDNALNGGFMPGSFYVLAGPTSKGKSALASNLARRMAKTGLAITIVTLEDPPAQLVRKMISAEGHVPLTVTEKLSAVPPNYTMIVGNAMTRLEKLEIRIAETSDLNDLAMLITDHAKTGTNVFIIDQMSHISCEAEKEQDRITKITRRMQQLTKATGAVIIMLCQVNRDGSKSDDGPTLHDLRESGNIENDARGVLLIKSLDMDDNTKIGTMTVCIAKHSFGPRDVFEKFTFFANEQRIEEYAPEVR